MKSDDMQTAELLKIGRRLAEARRGAKMTLERLAARIGVSKQLVNHWERGKTHMNILQVRKVASVLGADIDYLLTGLVGASSRGQSIKLMLPKARIVPMATQRELLEIAQGNLSHDEIEDRRAVYSRCSDETVMFEVADRSMEPSFPERTLITVDRQRRPEPGDCVAVALLATGEVLFRRFRPSSDGKSIDPPYTLRSENDDFEPRSVTKAMKPVFLGTKIEHSRATSR
jgi:transcriptional regulator with XRE-family HTH domain